MGPCGGSAGRSHSAWNNLTEPRRNLEAPESWSLSGNYARVAQTIHPEEFIAGYGGPVLLVHGDADESVPVQCSMDAARQYSNAELVLIKGDTHCFDYHLEEVVEAIRKWMVRRLS